MPAYRIQLGSKRSRWHVRESEVPRAIPGHLQSAPGRFGCHPAHARTLGLANGCQKEVSAKHDVRTRHNVSEILLQYITRQLTWSSSICVITLIRVHTTSAVTDSNSQKVYSLVALLTCLEALLGVINACLPVLKPIFARMASTKPANWLSSVMSGSIPIFMRPSQMGTTYNDSDTLTKRNSASRQPFPMRKWPGSSNRDCGAPRNSATIYPSSTPPPRYVENKPARMMVSPNYTSTSVSSSIPAVDTSRPPVPPKMPFDRDISRGRWEPGQEKGGIWVQKEWDLERGDRGEMQRGLLREAERRRNRF